MFLSFDHLSSSPYSHLELSISAKNLVDKDFITVSDPLCVVYSKSAVSSRYHEIGRTEIIWNNLNPNWVKRFRLDYYFEEVQYLKFVIVDVDTEHGTDISKQDFLGSLECTLGEIVSAGSEFKRSLQHVKHGEISIRCEEIIDNQDYYTFEFHGEGLDRKDFFGKSDPYFTIEKSNETEIDNSYTIVKKSEVKKITLNPKWKRFEISCTDLCNGDIERELRIRVFDWNANGRDSLIGETRTTARQLEEPFTKKLVNAKICFANINIQPDEKKYIFQIFLIKAAKKKKYKHSGILKLTHSIKERRATFLEYIRGGMEMNFIVGIDFTQSNGNPDDPQSLHYIQDDRNFLNQYEVAITSVGSIIQDYDSDKLFPLLGFGAQLPPTNSVSHNFAVNFNPNNPDCAGIRGVLEAYRKCIRSVLGQNFKI